MPGPFVARFRSVVEPLFGRPFTSRDGYTEDELDAAQSRAGYELPEALQDFYQVVGRFDPVLESHNRFYSPETLSRMDEKLVFCEENQVVVYWGYQHDEGWRTDPPVYQGINNEEIEWYVEPGHCSDFLIGMIYWQALWGGLPHFRSGNASASHNELTAGWPLVLQDEESQLFSRGSSVLCLIRNEAGIEIQAAALAEEELARLWRSLGMEA